MSNINLHNFQNDLIEDATFIRWVKSDFQENDEKWSEFIDEHLEQIEEINKAIAFVRDISFKDEEINNYDALWTRIAKTTNVNVQKGGNVKSIFHNRRSILALLAAASVILILVFTMGITFNKQVNTSIAQQTTESLPDGSNIVIGADSKVSYSPKKWKDTRDVKLEGTAFFKVQKGKTFTVKTELGSVTVLGTSFNVTARKSTFEVICKTGKVSVKAASKNSDEVILLPGDKVVLNNEALVFTSSKVNQKKEILWLDGVFTFEKNTLAEVVEELERQFDVDVTVSEELLSTSYTGFFRNNDIGEALKSVTWPLGLQYEVVGKKAIIKK